jgi:hypothetical protein
VILLSIIAAVSLAALLGRRILRRMPWLTRAELARHRRVSEEESREWVFPFEI